MNSTESSCDRREAIPRAGSTLAANRPTRVLRIALCCALVLRHPIAPAVIEVGGACNLPDAISAANDDTNVGGCSAGSGADTILLSATVELDTVAVLDEGENGLPTVTSEITIDGGGSSITRDQAGPLFRIVKVDELGDLTLQNVTLSHGSIGSDDPPVNYDGGAVLSRGRLTLADSHITESRTTRLGGAIASFGEAVLENSTVTFNDASDGGGIYNMGLMEITESTLRANHAFGYSGWGGGIFNGEDGDLTISKSTLDSNSANLDYGSGGAIQSSGALVVFNSTISNNFAPYAGAISAVATIANSTFYGNDTIPETAYYSSALKGTFTLYGTILQNYDDFDTHNCQFATIIDLGNNFADDASCGSIPNVDPGLDTTLADNGGPTRTHALLQGSVAIDSGQACPAATDQRGVPRDDGACDSGAFEVGCKAPDGDEVTLEGGWTVVEEKVETCLSITVRDWAVFSPGGHLILRTAGVVALDDDFEVGVDGRLTVENDDGLLGGEVEPPDS